MSQLQERLKEILNKKNWGQNENDVIIQSFHFLEEYYYNEREQLEDFLDNLEELKQFEVVLDVNEDDYFKNYLEELTDNETKIKDQHSTSFRNFLFFTKENNNYIQDFKGNYILETVGVFNESKKQIKIYGKDLTTFFHEFEHLKQVGFRIHSSYFGSGELMKILQEGDAVDFELSIKRKTSEVISINDIYYMEEYYIFKNLQLLLGKDFINEWKTTKNKDFMMDVLHLFKENYSEEILEAMITFLFLLVSKNENINLSDEIFGLLQRDIDKYIKDLEDLRSMLNTHIARKEELIEQEKEILDLKQNMENPQFISGEILEQTVNYQELKSEYQNILNNIRSFKGNKESLKNYILSLGGDFDCNIDYEKECEMSIDIYEKKLQGNAIETEVIEELKNKINNLTWINNSRVRVEKSIQFYKEQVKSGEESLEILKFSLNTFTKVKEYQNLLANCDDKNVFESIILLKLSILFHECFKQKISRLDNADSFLDEYFDLKFMYSIIFSKNVEIKNSNLMEQQMFLIMYLEKSFFETLELFMKKTSDNSEKKSEILQISELIGNIFPTMEIQHMKNSL